MFSPPQGSVRTAPPLCRGSRGASRRSSTPTSSTTTSASSSSRSARPSSKHSHPRYYLASSLHPPSLPLGSFLRAQGWARWASSPAANWDPVQQLAGIQPPAFSHSRPHTTTSVKTHRFDGGPTSSFFTRRGLNPLPSPHFKTSYLSNPTTYRTPHPGPPPNGFGGSFYKASPPLPRSSSSRSPPSPVGRIGTLPRTDPSAPTAALVTLTAVARRWPSPSPSAVARVR